MGIACASDIFQSIMMELLGDLEHVQVYIDDVLILQKAGKSEVGHITKTDKMLGWLDIKGFCANLHKSFFLQKEVEHVYYLLSTGGLKPQHKKIEAINHTMHLKDSKQLKMFLGIVNFYCDMFPKCSHFSALLE